MSKNIEVVYENGIFKPIEPVALPEGTRATITLPEEIEDPIYTIYEDAEETGINDLAVNIDHYLYGLPKKCQ